MQEKELLPHLFRNEYRKIISVITKLFGFEHIEIAEDIVSETFLQASETWGLKGLPENPVAWLYKVSKNKALDLIKHDKIFSEKISKEIKKESEILWEFEIDLSSKNINDSQLQMMFAICHPSIPVESQIGLALNILCGFGADEIADAFLSNRETIYKRLSRAKEKLRDENIKVELPSNKELKLREDAVLATLYLLFSEGYYSSSQNKTLRKELCIEAMRLNLMLLENENTGIPSANALLSMMCFHASRFDARQNSKGELILYEEQDESLWNAELIERGEYYLNRSAIGTQISKYHFEAAIAYWHTKKKDSEEKWQNILMYYNRLLMLEYSPVAALNRTYALSKVKGKKKAIAEAEKLALEENQFYHTLLAELYSDSDKSKAAIHYNSALKLAKSESDKAFLKSKLSKISES